MKKSWYISACLAGVVMVGASCAMLALQARATVLAADVTSKVTSLQDAVHQGERIFASDSFASKRLFKGKPATCASCHSNNGKSEGVMPDGTHLPSLVGAAANFPKFNSHTHAVVTLEEQVMGCIKGGLHGTRPAYNSPKILNLLTYLTWLSKGSVMGKQF